MWLLVIVVFFKVFDRDQVVCGVYIFVGIIIVWVFFSFLRSKKIFGEDVDVFRFE